MFTHDDARLTLVKMHQAALRREAAHTAQAHRVHRDTTGPGKRPSMAPFAGHAAPVALVARALVRRGHEVRDAGHRGA